MKIGKNLINHPMTQTKDFTEPRYPELNPQQEIIARKMIHNILYDNGMVNRSEPETEKRYPIKYIKPISIAAGIFFEAHPEFLTDEDLDNICCGEQTENQEKYGIYPEYEALDIALNRYFNKE